MSLLGIFNGVNEAKRVLGIGIDLVKELQVQVDALTTELSNIKVSFTNQTTTLNRQKGRIKELTQVLGDDYDTYGQYKILKVENLRLAEKIRRLNVDNRRLELIMGEMLVDSK